MKIRPCEDHMSKIEFHKRSFKKINLSEGNPVIVTEGRMLRFHNQIRFHDHMFGSD